jgi:hypothetical protein
MRKGRVGEPQSGRAEWDAAATPSLPGGMDGTCSAREGPVRGQVPRIETHPTWAPTPGCRFDVDDTTAGHWQWIGIERAPRFTKLASVFLTLLELTRG